jgi:hypothetical protein
LPFGSYLLFDSMIWFAEGKAFFAFFSFAEGIAHFVITKIEQKLAQNNQGIY